MDPFKNIIFRARMVEDEPAIASIDGVVTYRALANAVAAAHEALGTLDLRPGGLVALEVKNAFFHIALMLALGLRGLPSASIQSQMSVRASGVFPAMVLTDTPGSTFAGTRSVEIAPAWFAAQGNPDYTALLASRGFTDGNELVRVAFSSGTTGIPKAVGVRLKPLNTRLGHAIIRGVRGRERLVAPPAFSVLGLFTGLLAQFSEGYTMILSASVAEMIHLTRVFQGTSIGLSVAQLEAALKVLDGKPPLSSLKMLHIGGSKLLRTVLREAQAKLTSFVVSGYASTEAGSITYGTGETIAAGDGSVGYAYPGVRIEAVDGEHRPLSPGGEGILRVKTDEMVEYLNPGPETDVMFRDGWFYPGDVGSVDRDRRVTITGRTTEVINRGGAIVAPEYVEAVLKTVTGVREVAVFGVMNATGVEEIWAAVVADDGLAPETIIPAVRDRLVDKVPDKIVRVTEIPRGEMGKVKRKELRERVLAMPGVRS